jgi:hypothetical protein
MYLLICFLSHNLGCSLPLHFIFCLSAHAFARTYPPGWELALKKKNYKNEANVAINNTKMDFTQKKCTELMETTGRGDYRLAEKGNI